MFQIRWEESALEELTSAWLKGDSTWRQAITEATHSIDQLLRSNPHQQGESRDNAERVLFVPPLGVNFEVDSQRRIVSIYHVWIFRKRDR